MVKPRRHSERGFTLIEMVVVLTLIGLLISIAAPRYFHVVDHGRESVQRQNLAVVRDAIDKYLGDLGRYPDSLDDLVAHKYLRAVPVDPLSGKPDWVVVAPPDPSQGAVFDITPAGASAEAAASAASAS